MLKELRDMQARQNDAGFDEGIMSKLNDKQFEEMTRHLPTTLNDETEVGGIPWGELKKVAKDRLFLGSN